MKKIIPLILLILNGFYGISQNLFWAKNMGGTGGGGGTSIAVDVAGNVYTTGSCAGVTDFDPGIGTYTLASAGYADVFVTKFDVFGNFVWARSIGGIGSDAGSSLTIDGFGNVYVTGTFANTVDFDPSTNTFALSSAGGSSDFFIMKLDNAGNFVWAKSVGGIYYDETLSIKLDNLGNIYTTGSFEHIVDFDPGAGTYILSTPSASSYNVFLLKLNNNGDFIWVKKTEGLSHSDQAYSIAIDPFNNIYLTGYYGATTDFDFGLGTYTLTSLGSLDIFILKLDPSGNFVWAKGIGCISATSEGNSIVVDKQGNSYVAGTFYGTADFNPNAGTYSLTSVGNEDAFVLKLNTAGNFLWAKNVGSLFDDGANSIAIDTLDNIYTSGCFKGLVDFDPSPTNTYTLTSNGFTDVFILKLDSAGNFIWAKAIGGNDYDCSYSTVIDAKGSSYTTGYFKGIVDFDPNNGINNITSIGTSDIFVLKLGNCGSVQGKSTICGNNQSSTYAINPIIGITNYTWTVSSGAIINSGQGTPSINVTFTNTPVYITVNPGDSCGSTTSNSITVNVSTRPTVSPTVSPSSKVCLGSSIILNGMGATSYEWTGGIINGVPFTPTTTGIFTHTVIGILSTNGCTNSATQLIIVNNIPNVTATTSNTLICIGETATISINGANTYSLNSTSCISSIVISPTVTSTYNIVGINTTTGCKDSVLLIENVNACIGIKELSLEPIFIVHPNPTTSSFTLKSTEPTDLTIINALGETLKTLSLNHSNNNQISIEGFSAGIYFIVSNLGQRSFNQKIIVTQ